MTSTRDTEGRRAEVTSLILPSGCVLSSRAADLAFDIWRDGTGTLSVCFTASALRELGILEEQVSAMNAMSGATETPNGAYVAVDLTANNRHMFPDNPELDLGWGVCRQGYGLQGHQGNMSEAAAKSRAQALNARAE